MLEISPRHLIIRKLSLSLVLARAPQRPLRRQLLPLDPRAMAEFVSLVVGLKFNKCDIKHLHKVTRLSDAEADFFLLRAAVVLQPSRRHFIGK
jgi:hypothetical protein